MQADLAQDLRVDGGNPLVCHQLLRVGDDRWYWYQRYHHLLVDGFSFPAITRQIAAIYRAWQRGKPRLSRLYPFAEVVDEYQRYAGSEAWQRDKAFWQAQRRRYRHRPRSLPRRWRTRRQERYLADEAGDGCRRLPPPGQARRSVSAPIWRWR
jgi:hypothetical protein